MMWLEESRQMGEEREAAQKIQSHRRSSLARQFKKASASRGVPGPILRGLLWSTPRFYQLHEAALSTATRRAEYEIAAFIIPACQRREMPLTNVLEDVDDEKRRDQVVDALHVAAGRVADGPDEKDPLKNLTKTHAHTKTQGKYSLSTCQISCQIKLKR